MKSFIVTGTDTGIGKTLVSALLVKSLNASYWKPTQSGLDEETDTEFVKRVSGCSDEKIIPEVFRLNQPLSPHLSALRDGVQIELEDFEMPKIQSEFLIVEGAGGVLVPLNWKVLQIELFKKLNVPVVIVARTKLGTINHTLLTIEALRARDIQIHGVVLNGDFNLDNRNSIEKIGKVKILGWVPPLSEINSEILQQTFDQHFNKEDWK